MYHINEWILLTGIMITDQVKIQIVKLKSVDINLDLRLMPVKLSHPRQQMALQVCTTCRSVSVASQSRKLKTILFISKLLMNIVAQNWALPKNKPALGKNANLKNIYNITWSNKEQQKNTPNYTVHIIGQDLVTSFPTGPLFFRGKLWTNKSI